MPWGEVKENKIEKNLGMSLCLCNGKYKLNKIRIPTTYWKENTPSHIQLLKSLEVFLNLYSCSINKTRIVESNQKVSQNNSLV